MDKIKFAVAGCGNIALKHVEAINAADKAELTFVYDIDRQKAQQLASGYHVQWTSDYQELLKKKNVDVVCICTPSAFHASMGITAARAGKHVLVEKPMALSLEDADALIQACIESQVQLGVVLQNRFKPAVVCLKNAVDQGYFGKLTHGTAVVRWNRNRSYYQQSSWRGSPAMGGGVLINQAIHNIDLLNWIMGPVESLSAYTSKRLLNLEVEDVAVAVLKFNNGALGVIEAASTIYPESLEESIAIFGEKGTAVIGGKKADEIKVWKIAGERGDLFPAENKIFRAHLSHLPCIEDMINSINTGKPPAVNGYEGRKSLEIVLAMQRSANKDKMMELPLS
jgi:UDP-N-acetyl-2-amino-2-deoxyglucuronate dehydrogenase